MAEPVKVVATKIDDLSSIRRALTEEEVTPASCALLHTCMVMCTPIPQ